MGVVGVIERSGRKPGGYYYHVGYTKPFSLPNEKTREKHVIVREDDLEPVAGDTPRFAMGEQVIVNAPGWIWDRHVVTVKGCDKAGSEQAWLYTVAINWPSERGDGAWQVRSGSEGL